MPDLPEPEATAQEPPTASAPETTIPMDTAPEAPAPTTKTMTEASVNPEASGSAPPADDPDVVITRTEFVEPGRPTALAKCSAKGELLQPHRVSRRFGRCLGSRSRDFRRPVHWNGGFEAEAVGGS